MPRVPMRTRVVPTICGQPGFDHHVGAREDGEGHERDRQADFQRLPHGSHEGGLGDARRDGRRERGRRRQLAPDRQQEDEEMRDPGIDAELGQGPDDDDRADDVGRRRRQAHADQPAEDKGHADHGHDVPRAEVEQHAAHAVDEAGDGEQAGS